MSVAISALNALSKVANSLKPDAMALASLGFKAIAFVKLFAVWTQPAFEENRCGVPKNTAPIVAEAMVASLGKPLLFGDLRDKTRACNYDKRWTYRSWILPVWQRVPQHCEQRISLGACPAHNEECKYRQCRSVEVWGSRGANITSPTPFLVYLSQKRASSIDETRRKDRREECCWVIIVAEAQDSNSRAV